MQFKKHTENLINFVLFQEVPLNCWFDHVVALLAKIVLNR